jgi:hypothetical protein
VSPAQLLALAFTYLAGSHCHTHSDSNVSLDQWMGRIHWLFFAVYVSQHHGYLQMVHCLSYDQLSPETKLCLFTPLQGALIVIPSWFFVAPVSEPLPLLIVKADEAYISALHKVMYRPPQVERLVVLYIY